MTKAKEKDSSGSAAKKKEVSNCPLCALGNNANKTRIYKFAEMDADHVSA